MISQEKRPTRPRSWEQGFTLLEMSVAFLILLVGVTGGVTLMILAIQHNTRARMDSTGTVLAQMTVEAISSVSGSSSATITINDCNPTTSSASHLVDTAGSTTGAGAPLNSSGAIDFTQATVSGYSMTFYTCQASTGDRQALYDVRWNIKTLSPYTKLVIVAAQKQSTVSAQADLFAVPASLKVIVGN